METEKIIAGIKTEIASVEKEMSGYAHDHERCEIAENVLDGLNRSLAVIEDLANPPGLFTQGMWESQVNDKTALIFVDKGVDIQEIAEVRNCQEYKANAVLMAASKQLLEVCEELFAEASKNNILNSALIIKTNAILRKARGGRDEKA